MSDLISRRDAIDAIQNQAIHTPEALNDIGIAYYEGLHFAFQLISMLPSAEKTGKWMQTATMNVFECSCCHSRWNIHYVSDFDYCPHCGTKMEDE